MADSVPAAVPPPVDHAEAERQVRADHRPVCRWEHPVDAPPNHDDCVDDCLCCGVEWPCPTDVLLAEYDRRGAELVRVPSDMAVLRGERDRCAAALDAARAELERLRAQRAAVLALHNRDEIAGRPACGHCSMAGLDGDGVPVGPILIVGWPCPTAETLGVTE